MENPSSTQPSGTGYLVVRASTAGGAIPLEGATVKIWNDAQEGEDASDVRYMLRTDRDGNTQHVSLPAPPRVISYTPGSVPYALYHVDVTAKGYYPQHFVRVPVYDTVTSIQNAYLIPLPEGSYYDGREPLGDVVEEGTNPAL